jgi:hypothetical protein
MPEVFQYPMSYPTLWLDYYFIATWSFGMLFLGLVWAVFYRYGKFTYGVDLGCFWKTTLLVLFTTVSLGGPNYYNTRFAGEHGQDGDSIKISDDTLLYLDRKGNEKKLGIADIKAIYQESITYNPPPKIFIVAVKPSLRDSLFVTTNLPGYKRFLDELSRRTGIEAKLR